MKSLVFSIILGFAISFPLMAQSRGTGSGSPGLGADVSGALSQMEGALAQPDEDMSFQDAYFLGRAVAANILSRYGPYTEKPALTHYLNQICTAITINSPTPEIYGGYHVSILDSPDLNAFATTGGHIFVCRGLLEAVSSEDALAAVLAHEIAHIQLKHSDEIIKNMRLTQALSDIAQRAGDIAAREAGLREREVLFSNYVRELVTTLVVNGYSRDKEFEADSYALTLLALAGYSPASLVEVLTLLQRAGGVDGYNGTHPSPAQRINNVRNALPRYRVQDTSSSRSSRFADFVK
ncbi:M48 family metalloprotease [Treponema primitia]|uniref:M48 family metalloprotease n=1 Tax=Treponema primitia TaxID=88058 RepID=UPI0002554DF7|nr:M48 family metalloprotease [Treponema primitia]